MKQSRPRDLVFYAEDVWAHLEPIRPNAHIDLLWTERRLAELADVIIIVVEGEGAINELGAFAWNGPLQRKLVAIVDPAHKTGRSFIELGPLKEIERASDFGPTIFCDFNDISKTSGDLKDRLAKLNRPKRQNVAELRLSLTQLLFLLCDLLVIIGPVPIDHCRCYLTEIGLVTPIGRLEIVLSLGVALGLLSTHGTSDDGWLYSRPLHEGEKAYLALSGKPLNLAAQRAALLGVLGKIPSTPHWFGLCQR